VNSLNLLQEFVAVSRYARWLEEEGRRESWEDTVTRYVNFMNAHTEGKYDQVLRGTVFPAILTHKVMPSMRALMTAGPALLRENIASFNCAFMAINSKRKFAEALYILMCFHPDTKVVTLRGDVAIKDVLAGDYVRSFDESTQCFNWCRVTSQVRTPSAKRPKVEILLENGKTVRCTADHPWLTSNRSWVEAQDLTPDDDLVAPTHSIYKIARTQTGEAYIGMTCASLEDRFSQHASHALRGADSHLHRAIRAHGIESFTIELVDVAYTRKEAAAKERYWIKAADTFGEGGYNVTLGGEGVAGYQWTEEQRQQASETAYERTPEHREALRATLLLSQEKIIATRKTPEYRNAQRLRNLGDRNPMFGQKLPDKRKTVISVSQMGEGNAFFGRTHSGESKQKISDAKKGTGVGEENPFFGRKHSPETRAKMSAAWAAKREQKRAGSEAA